MYVCTLQDEIRRDPCLYFLISCLFKLTAMLTMQRWKVQTKLLTNIRSTQLLSALLIIPLIHTQRIYANTNASYIHEMLLHQDFKIRIVFQSAFQLV